MDVKELAAKLISFESTHENVPALHACLDFCVAYFKDLEPVVKQYSCNGLRSVVIGTHDTLEPTVLLLGHIDTVPGNPSLFIPRIEGGRLYGRGTLDMKAFVATSMKVLENSLNNGDKSVSVALAIVTDEELGGTYGARYLVEDIGYKPSIVLIPDDGEDIATVIEATKHIFQVKFEAKGKEAHANRPWDGINAIELLYKTFENLKKVINVPEVEPIDRFIDTCSLGIIKGGVASNEVPEHAMMLVDVRIASGKSRREVEEIVNSCLSSGVTATITLEGLPTRIDIESPLIKKYLSSVEIITKQTPKLIKTGGATDARYFSAKNIPTIVHQGNGHGAQASDEHVKIESLEKLIEIQNHFIKSLV